MKRAPGPKGGLILGSLPAFKADALGFLSKAVQDHGDIVRFRFGPITAHVVNHPDFVEHVLSRNSKNYDKTTRSADRIAATTGQSLLSPNQNTWQRHRKLIQPAFQPRCFDNIGPAIDAFLTPALDRWQDTDTIDIVDEMMQLVIGAVVKILFSTDIDPQDITAPLEVILADTWRRIEAPLDTSMLSPLLHKRAFKDAVQQIDQIVFDQIRTRRGSTQRPDDVLSRLLAAHETEGDAQLGDQELRDAAVTLLLAGHETTANALAWAFIHGGPSDADPQHVFAEAIRLYPSIWVIERRAINADVIGDYHIPRGSAVLISPYLLHRHPAFWSDPNDFDPSRFAKADTRPRHAYLPFGLGQHRCVGLHLAKVIAGHVMTQVNARYQLRLCRGQTLGTNPGITLRHKSRVMMNVAKR